MSLLCSCIFVCNYRAERRVVGAIVGALGACWRHWGHCWDIGVIVATLE